MGEHCVHTLVSLDYFSSARVRADRVGEGGGGGGRLSGRVVRAQPHETLALGMQEIGSGNTETVPLVAVLVENASKRTKDKGEQFFLFSPLCVCVCFCFFFVRSFVFIFLNKRATECIIPY